MNQINNWTQAEGALNVTLYQNRMGDKGGYYGRVGRRTIGLNTLIGMIAKKRPGISEGIMQVTAGYLQEEILAMIAMGFTVNLLELGTLYLAPNGGIGGKQTKDVPTLVPRFTPSEKLVNQAAAVVVEKVTVAAVGPQIEKVVDTSNAEGDGSSVTIDKVVRITGTRLKMGGDNNGVYFVPEIADGYLSEDESDWIKVDPHLVITNLPKKVEFYVPTTVQAGQKYAIAIRTQLSNSKTLMTPQVGYGPLVEIKG
ncbi:MAG: DUF4469 domain-containing protein [Treponema sp.]|nr:DUF4469 domain-containing protein [Treponema sp.]